MGYVYVKALIGDPRKTRTREIKFLAHTGAGYMVLRPELAKERTHPRAICEKGL